MVLLSVSRTKHPGLAALVLAAVPVAIGGCNERHVPPSEPTLTAPSVEASTVSPASSSAPVHGAPLDLGPMLALTPSDTDNLVVVRLDSAAADDRTRAAVAGFTDWALAQLPFPDELILQLLLLNVRDGFASYPAAMRWFSGFELVTKTVSLPSFAEVVLRPKGSGLCTAAELDVVGGVKVYEALSGYPTSYMCPDDKHAIFATPSFLEETAKALGAPTPRKGPTQSLLGANLPPDVWAAGAWTGTDPRWPLEAAVFRAHAVGSRTMLFEAEVKVKGEVSVVEDALAQAVKVAEPKGAEQRTHAVREILGEIRQDRSADWVRWKIELDPTDARLEYFGLPPKWTLDKRGGDTAPRR